MASKKRVSVPLAEKKRYCEMIKKRASRSTVSELYRKKHGEELAERTWRRWKADCKSICELNPNSKFYQSRNSDGRKG